MYKITILPPVVAKIHFRENYKSFWMIYSYNDWMDLNETHSGYLKRADNYNSNLNLITFDDD